MQLPSALRDSLVESLDGYFEALGKSPDSEAATAYTIELLEEYADESGVDDMVLDLEESGALDDSLQSVVEAEIDSNDEFECTGEEMVSLLERLCGIEWIGGDTESGDDDDDDDDDF
ncbi:MAG: hypothetical protein ACI8PZ_003790 [Myxococcota bacterium]